MKITIDIDCTPQEARAFLGLPHVEPMQEALLAQMQERLAQHLEAIEPDALMSAWLPGGIKGLAAAPGAVLAADDADAGPGREEEALAKHWVPGSSPGTTKEVRARQNVSSRSAAGGP